MQSLETLGCRVSGWAEQDPGGRAQGEGDVLGKLGIFLLLPRGSEVSGKETLESPAESNPPYLWTVSTLPQWQNSLP